MITLTFKATDRRVVENIRGRSVLLKDNLANAVSRSMLELQARVQQKLSGKVLKSHHGLGGLLGTVRVEPTRAEGYKIIGSVRAGGGLFWWASVHEFGGEKTFEILPGAVTGKSSKRALAFFPAGSEGSSFGRTATTRLRFAAGARRGSLRPERLSDFHAAGGIVVRRVEHPPLPRRSFMRSSLDELRDKILENLTGALTSTLKS